MILDRCPIGTNSVKMPRIISSSFDKNLGKKAFNNLGETIAAVNPEANDNTSDEAED